ncbi:MAG: hypothetical protein WBR18_03040 [Anaerolineales bacterium]
MIYMFQKFLSILQPPYSWVLLLVMALPYWVLFVGVFFSRLPAVDEHGWFTSLGSTQVGSRKSKRELARYAAVLTTLWLLILAFKVYQQYFSPFPLANTDLGVFDLSLGLFSLASWAGIVLLETQERL